MADNGCRAGRRRCHSRREPHFHPTELAPTGKLRVGLLVGSLGPSTFYTARDPTTGRLRGVTIDLAGALARELGVPLDLVPYPSAEALNHSATAGAWDVTFMTVDHQRETLVDFGPAYRGVAQESGRTSHRGQITR